MRSLQLALTAGLFGSLLGCGPGRLAPPSGAPAPDPVALEERLRAATVPDSPQQVNFAWTLDERGSRIRGDGVARLEAPERIRLDLFGTRGETYLIAALVGSEYRLPPQVAGSVTLPSPSLLWSAIGVLQPPAGARLSSATTTETGAELRYNSQDGQQFVFTFDSASGQPRLVQVQRASPRGVVESVGIERGTDGSITRTRYRDYPAFRELTLEVRSIRTDQSFPASIWTPDAASQ